ncbi:M14 family metallopeptidase [Persephonella sp.]
MIEEVFSIDLRVSEKFYIKRHRHRPHFKTEKRISILSGIHGDELEGQMVCFLLNEFLLKNKEKIKGIIDIYPSINSVGIDSIVRNVPPTDVDLNRVFPGSPDGTLPERIAHAVVEAVKGSEIAIDIHSSNIFLTEIPQIRISEENADSVLPIAQKLNVDFIWIHGAVTVLRSTFAHTMNSLGTKTLVVEMGVGMRITQEYCYQLFDGIVNLLAEEDFLEIEVKKQIRKPIVSTGGEVHFLNAEAPGIFIQAVNHGKWVKKGQQIGKVVSPLSGEVVHNVLSPADGFLFTLREYPVVYEGSLLARIYEEKNG